jgi:hypothetical protein
VEWWPSGWGNEEGPQGQQHLPIAWGLQDHMLFSRVGHSVCCGAYDLVTLWCNHVVQQAKRNRTFFYLSTADARKPYSLY